LTGHLSERKIWFIVAIGLLVILSWAGSLDKYSDNYTSSAIVQAGSAYAVARGINATVSMLQTSTISAGVGISGSITIGEILDPLNDLIERFSEVMTIALGSLALQKILLAIAANKLFSGLLTLFGLLSIIVVWVGKTGTFPLLLKLFILLVVVRFALGIVVLSNGTVSHIFLSGHIEESSARLGELKEDINNLQRDTEGVLSKLKNLKQTLTASAIEARVSSFVQNIIDLLILFILKAILIPLMFFYIFMRFAKAAWRMDWEQLIACEK